MSGSYWQRQTAAAIPPLKSVGALVEVLPSLSKYFIDAKAVRERPGAHSVRQGYDENSSIQGTRHDQGSGDGLQRTKSEEMEAELILAKDMLKREKEENALLLKTISKLQESTENFSVQDNEIMLLRDSILQKHDIINRLHAESIELSNK
jgi:hypothetical protein